MVRNDCNYRVARVLSVFRPIAGASTSSVILITDRGRVSRESNSRCVRIFPFAKCVSSICVHPAERPSLVQSLYPSLYTYTHVSIYIYTRLYIHIRTHTYIHSHWLRELFISRYLRSSSRLSLSTGFIIFSRTASEICWLFSFGAYRDNDIDFYLSQKLELGFRDCL